MELPEQEQCGRCKQYFFESMMYDITTPNIEIQLCMDCAIEIEEDLMHLAYKTTTNDASKQKEVTDEA